MCKQKWIYDSEHDCEYTVNQSDNPSELWPSIMIRTIEKQGMDYSDEVNLWL